MTNEEIVRKSYKAYPSQTQPEMEAEYVCLRKAYIKGLKEGLELQPNYPSIKAYVAVDLTGRSRLILDSNDITDIIKSENSPTEVELYIKPIKDNENAR